MDILSNAYRKKLPLGDMLTRRFVVYLSPDAASMPVLRACDRPGFGSKTRLSGKRLLNCSTMMSVSSVQLLFTTMISQSVPKGGSACVSEPSNRERDCARFQVHMTMLSFN